MSYYVAKKHNEGIKCVGISCSKYDQLRKLTDELNKKELKTADGFVVKLTLSSVLEAGVDLLLAKYKIKK